MEISSVSDGDHLGDYSFSKSILASQQSELGKPVMGAGVESCRAEPHLLCAYSFKKHGMSFRLWQAVPEKWERGILHIQSVSIFAKTFHRVTNDICRRLNGPLKISDPNPWNVMNVLPMVIYGQPTLQLWLDPVQFSRLVVSDSATPQFKSD